MGLPDAHAHTRQSRLVGDFEKRLMGKQALVVIAACGQYAAHAIGPDADASRDFRCAQALACEFLDAV